MKIASNQRWQGHYSGQFHRLIECGNHWHSGPWTLSYDLRSRNKQFSEPGRRIKFLECHRISEFADALS